MTEDVLALLIPFGAFIAITIVFVTWFFFRHKEKAATQETFRLALEKGSELSPEFIKQLGTPEPSKDRDLRRGLIWLAVGLAFALLGLAVNEPDAIGPMLGVGSFPALVGVAYLIMWRYGHRKE